MIDDIWLDRPLTLRAPSSQASLSPIPLPGRSNLRRHDGRLEGKGDKLCIKPVTVFLDNTDAPLGVPTPHFRRDTQLRVCSSAVFVGREKRPRIISPLQNSGSCVGAAFLPPAVGYADYQLSRA
jgi:hypothetical protein